MGWHLAILGHLVLSLGTAPGPAPTPPREAPRAEAPAVSPAQQPLTPEERARRLAQVLDPREYAPAFLTGAQAEYVGPAFGVSSLVLGYDAVWAQAEASVGVVAGDDPLSGSQATNVYNVALRLAVPVHRGIRADFSLLGGSGASFLNPPDADERTLWFLLAGARFRLFMSPNVATVATFGGALVLARGATSVLVGARPLGSAGVVYFFR